METLLTVREVAKQLKVAPATVRIWTKAGKIPATILPGNTMRFRASAVQDWVERQTKYKTSNQ